MVKELKAKLNVDLGIEKLSIQPFNSLELQGVYIFDQKNDEILKAEKLYASIDLLPLLSKRVVVSSIKLNNFHVSLSKADKNSPLNIQFIIDAFKSDNNNTKSAFEVKISSINIGDGKFNFDIKDQPYLRNTFDKNHIEVTDLNARFALKSLLEDSLNIQIRQLSLVEKSGLTINNLIARLITQDKYVYIKGFKLDLPKSRLQLSRCDIDMTNINTIEEVFSMAPLHCNIQSTFITPQDVSAFVPLFSNFSDRIYLRSEISGTIDSLVAKNLVLDYGDKIKLEANALVKNVRKADQIYLKGNVEQLIIEKDGINSLINNLSTEKKELPEYINNLGRVVFNGEISGYIKNLKAYGLIDSQLGKIQADLLFGFKPKENIEAFYKGRVSTDNFELGKLLNNKDLNKLSFDLDVDLEKPINHKLSGKVDGHISHIDYKDYPYQNISLNGKYNGLKIEGEATIDDENVYLDIDGLFDLSKEQPELNFVAKLKNMRPDALHLSDKYLNSYLSFNINANFTGKHIDDSEGYLNIDSLSFTRDNKHFNLNTFLVEASGVSSDRKLKITSDILNGEVLGAYSFSTMIESFKQTFHPYLPALISVKEFNRKQIKENNLSLNFTINNTEAVSDIFSLPFTVFSEAKVIGFYNNIYNRFRVEVFYPSGKVAGAMMKSGYLVAENTNESITAKISGILTGKNNIQNNVSVSLSAKENVVNSDISFTNDSKNTFKGQLLASTVFSKHSQNSPLITDINISPSEIVLNDTTWIVEKSLIHIEPNRYNVKNFNIHSSLRDQSININGSYSKTNPDDAILVSLKSIDLAYVFNTLAIDALNFGGYATGTIQASNIDGNPYASVNLDVKDFAFNNTTFGQLKLHSELDEISKHLKLGGTITEDGRKTTDIGGFIDPSTQELSLDFDADRVDISFLNKYSKSLFNNVKGRGTGKIHLFGDFSNVTVEGKAFIQDGSLGINFLNTTYRFTDTIYLKKDLIYFNDIKFSDDHNNVASVSGKVAHDYFANFMYYVELHGEQFMLYNGSEAHNPMFHGKLFGTGSGSISGDEQVVNIDARLKTDPNTNIKMNFMEETVDNYSFITYRSKHEKDSISNSSDAEQSNKLKAFKSESGMDVNMNFYIDATPDATVEIVMDPVGGDVLKGAGTGALQFVWGSNSEPKLYGTYTINKGSYNFTFQKIIERKFQIQNGSTVLFRGDPFQANINVAAVYKLTANLNDLDKELALSAGQTNIPVECILNITGELRHPNIGMDVSLPSADGEVRRQVKSLMNNEDMVNRQMVYLLLLSKFYTPSYANAEHRSSDLASVASATLSTQLSKILSGIDDRWQFGTHIRTSDSEFTSTEVELILSSQLLNDRVLLNGNFGYRDNPQTSDAFIGDIDIEVLLNRIGTWRLKAYNHYNEKYYYIGSGSPIQTQGIGILYKKDFDHIREVFQTRSKNKPKEIKKDSVTPLIPDSTVKGSTLGSFVKIKE